MERLLADAQKLTGVKYDISNLADVYKAIHAIQENIGITGTTVLEAKETISGSFNAMKASFSDFLGNLALGKNLEPSLDNLFQTAKVFFVDNLLPMIGRIFEGLPQVVVVAFQKLPGLFARVGTEIISNLGISLSNNAPVINAFNSLKEALNPVFDAIKNTTSKIPDSFIALGNSVSPIVDSVFNAIGKLKFDGTKDLVNAILPALQTGFQNFVQIVGPAISMVANSFSGLRNSLQPLLSVLADSLMPAFELLSSFLGGVFKWALIAISGLFDGLRIVIDALTSVIDYLVQVFKMVVEPLKTIAEWVGTAIGLFSGLGISSTSMSDMIF